MVLVNKSVIRGPGASKYSFYFIDQGLTTLLSVKTGRLWQDFHRQVFFRQCSPQHGRRARANNIRTPNPTPTFAPSTM